MGVLILSILNILNPNDTTHSITLQPRFIPSGDLFVSLTNDITEAKNVIEVPPNGTLVNVLGDELVTNGGFDDGSSGWALSAGVTIENNLTNFESDTNAYQHIRQDIGALASKKYRVDLKVKNYVSGGLQLGFRYKTKEILNITTDGVYTAYISNADNGELFEISRDFNAGNFNFKIDSVSVKEVTGQELAANTYTYINGVLNTTFDLNVLAEDKFSLTINNQSKIIYKGSIFCTSQDSQDFKLTQGIYKYAE